MTNIQYSFFLLQPKTVLCCFEQFPIIQNNWADVEREIWYASCMCVRMCSLRLVDFKCCRFSISRSFKNNKTYIYTYIFGWNVTDLAEIEIESGGKRERERERVSVVSMREKRGSLCGMACYIPSTCHVAVRNLTAAVYATWGLNIRGLVYIIYINKYDDRGVRFWANWRKKKI